MLLQFDPLGELRRAVESLQNDLVIHAYGDPGAQRPQAQPTGARGPAIGQAVPGEQVAPMPPVPHPQALQ